MLKRMSKMGTTILENCLEMFIKAKYMPIS